MVLSFLSISISIHHQKPFHNFSKPSLVSIQMLSPFICGSFHHEEEEEPWSPSSTARRSRRNSFCRSNNKDSKNPYSTRGLDKFSALLSDLEEKRQTIYSQMGSQEISFVRFVYTNSNDCKPIVVKLREKKQEKTNPSDIKEEPITHNSVSEALDKYPIDSSAAEKEIKQPRLGSEKKTKKKSSSWNIMRLDRWRHPCYYLPAVIILILLFLAVFGRSVAILCTSVGWYVVPTIQARSSNSKKSTKKKEYTRRFSENKMASDGLASPKSNNNGVIKDKSPREHGHRKSW